MWKAAKGRTARGKRRTQKASIERRKASSEGHKATAKGKQHKAKGINRRRTPNGGIVKQDSVAGCTMHCICMQDKFSGLTNKRLQCCARQNFKPILQATAAAPCHCSPVFSLVSWDAQKPCSLIWHCVMLCSTCHLVVRTYSLF